MNIGSLYRVKKWSWLLFPTKEKAAASVTDAPSPDLADAPAAAASYWSKHYKCEVTCFSFDSYIVFLEEDGSLKKVLTSEGLIGWTWFSESYNHCFEEMKAKS